MESREAGVVQCKRQEAGEHGWDWIGTNNTNQGWRKERRVQFGDLDICAHPCLSLPPSLASPASLPLWLALYSLSITLTPKRNRLCACRSHTPPYPLFPQAFQPHRSPPALCRCHKWSAPHRPLHGRVLPLPPWCQGPGWLPHLTSTVQRQWWSSRTRPNPVRPSTGASHHRLPTTADPHDPTAAALPHPAQHHSPVQVLLAVECVCMTKAACAGGGGGRQERRQC